MYGLQRYSSRETETDLINIFFLRDTVEICSQGFLVAGIEVYRTFEKLELI